MKIEVADNSGFCFGVKRAIHIAIETAHQNHKVVTLGPIIHNPQMVQYLQKQGLGYVNNIDEITDETVIIRSHGITSGDYKKLLDKKINVVDATCPFVKKAQDFARKLTQEDFQLIIFGEKDHPEVKALLSFVDDSAIVVTSPDEKICLHGDKKIGLIAQTTQVEEKFEKLATRLLKKCRELYVVKTICNATMLRQSATKKLAKKVDIILVVGGKNSANTTRLAEIARSESCRTHHIEVADELKKEWFDDVKEAGITAGASTPDWIIKGVKKRMQNYE